MTSLQDLHVSQGQAIRDVANMVICCEIVSAEHLPKKDLIGS
jgi:hypothetical protein